MLANVLSTSMMAVLPDIPTAPGADLGFPVWIFATWGVALVFALWVIYVVVRELRNEKLEREILASHRPHASRIGPPIPSDRTELEEAEHEHERLAS